MTILEALEEANKAAGIKTFSFANIQEFNAFIDSFKGLDYPVNVVVPVNISGVFLNNMVKDVAAIQGWMLTRLQQDTDNFRSIKIEPDYIDPMRRKAKKFLRALLDTDIVDSEVESVSYTIRPEYKFLATNTFGVSYTMNLPILDHVC